MGKFMRKAKVTSEVAVMDVSPPTLGVRTRAKTLALQRLQREASASSYLELRSRRLEKPPVVVSAAASTYARRTKVTTSPPVVVAAAGSTYARRTKVATTRVSCPAKSVSVGSKKKRSRKSERLVGKNEVEASCGENVPDIDGRERKIRESTPCSMTRGSETLETPGSTTKSTNSATTSRRKKNALHQDIPSAREVDEFFDGAEKEQQRIFIEKYNFDPVNDMPLPGRYEWVRLDL
ncbi:hypothetical protein MRB53_035553 [Persea americana]|uniref:Uncharacterized protein n=1 Tax=Persea americana TaxID=3435 RepID=A0ACC2K4Z9_PERAE|nr:hypothetical protein MRB53_035553 [Persea americana]|eukprot:TRINITY_DN13517_c0_g1_i2.p1 TRINITY_DN13517_c0_g1~~TRINITY_DN13517_c0_g1_i2.p1  ORF type:complete len:236 (-),score=53.62 TRINITY_DN13517_c0_g1_i2:495-1202(-)